MTTRLFRRRGKARLRTRTREVRLNLTYDGAEEAGGQKTRSEGTGGILSNERQLSERGSNGRRHPGQLPPDLVPDSLRLVGG